MSIALFEAMKTNKTVRSLNVCVASLEEPHLTAIVDSLLENDTLQTFSVCAGCANACPIEDVDAAFLRILERNMCLRELDIRKVRPVAEDELEIDDSDDPSKFLLESSVVCLQSGRIWARNVSKSTKKSHNKL